MDSPLPSSGDRTPPPAGYSTPTYGPPPGYGGTPGSGASSPSFGVPTPPLAGMGSRAIAVIIDTFLIGIAGFVLALVVGAALGVSGVGLELTFVTIFLLALVIFLLMVFYFSYFESTSGQTLGKRVMSIRVVHLRTGQPPHLQEALIRNLCRLIDGLLFYLVGFILAETNSKRQRLGDMAADTIVVQAPAGPY